MEKKDELFKLGCKVGVLNDYFAINSFDKTDLINDFNINDIPIDKKTKSHLLLSVREAITKLSVGHGQGYIKCSCTGDCKTLRCSCRSASLKCSSKCHGKSFKCSNCD